MFKYKNWHDRQYQAIRLIAGKWSSMQWRSVRMPANISKVEDFALSQEDKPQKTVYNGKLCERLAYYWVQSAHWPIGVF